MAMAPKPKKALPKRPTGELPKRTSGYADYLQARRPSITKSAAAAQAGAVRDAGYNTSAFKKLATPAAKKPTAAKSNSMGKMINKRTGNK
jgi:hypothetical protein